MNPDDGAGDPVVVPFREVVRWIGCYQHGFTPCYSKTMSRQCTHLFVGPPLRIKTTSKSTSYQNWKLGSEQTVLSSGGSSIVNMRSFRAQFLKWCLSEERQTTNQ